MKVLCSKKICDMELECMAARIGGYPYVHVDIGTGSGRFVLTSAQKNREHFYIGMDPSVGSMRENAVKAAKQQRKRQLGNLLFVVASIEHPPGEMEGIADAISAILPWGSLRDGIVKADPAVLENMRRLGKTGAVLSVLVGYDGTREPGEMAGRALPVLSRDHFKGLSPVYREHGIALGTVDTVGNRELSQVQSDWAKRLAFGAPRTMYRLECMLI